MTCLVCNQETANQYSFEFGPKINSVRTGTRVRETYRVTGRHGFPICLACVRRRRRQRILLGLGFLAPIGLAAAACPMLPWFGTWADRHLNDLFPFVALVALAGIGSLAAAFSNERATAFSLARNTPPARELMKRGNALIRR